MPTLQALLSALVVTLLLGGAASAWLWKVRRARMVREQGLGLLSAMRWREFSKLVVDGLRDRGFEPEGAEDALDRSQDAVLHLRREGRGWLLACKQGTQQRVTATQVGDMFDAVRFHGAAGGILATTGLVEPAARRVANGRVDLIDGAALWPLVESHLGTSVRQELWETARLASIRHGILAWAVALAVGLTTTMAAPMRTPGEGAEASIAVTRAFRPAPAPAAEQDITPAPVSEEEQREEIIRLVSPLAGVDRVLWSTRSTLMVQLSDENADPVDDLCVVMDRYETLRTSRVHLQPPSGSQKPARFLQCRTF